jgi:uncharacterized membrane protein YdjX (TVP38/TMEM64 family)
MGKFFKRWLSIIILLICFSIFFYFDLDRSFTFTSLKQHREVLLTWTNENYYLAVALFLLIYILVVSISIPGATILTLTGGFLFGIYWGTIYVIVSATIGATCLFLAVRTALEPWFAKNTTKWIVKMRKGFQEGAFQYLLSLRLVPLFPFWVVNIVPALLGIKTSTFILATLIGIIPGTVVYVSLGTGLSQLFARNQAPDMKIIFEPQILFPLIALALLALLPIIYKK